MDFALTVEVPDVSVCLPLAGCLEKRSGVGLEDVVVLDGLVQMVFPQPKLALLLFAFGAFPYYASLG